MPTTKHKPAGKPSPVPATPGPSVSLAQVERTLGLTLAEAQRLCDKLSRREREIAGLMAQGLQNRPIAEQLGISEKTLDIHRSNVYFKLKTQSPAGVARVVWLVELGGNAGEHD